MNIPINVFQTATACKDSAAQAWLPAFEAACDEFGLNTPERVCAVLAHVGVESAGLTVFFENLNYSAQGLANTWGSRYSVTGRPGGAPNDLANRIARNPQAIANNVYANRMGNGDEASGDGWRHRGVGPIQLTGKDTQFAFMLACDVDMVNTPELLAEPKNGARSAVWFCTKYKAGFLAAIDAGDFDATTKIVNGQTSCAANHGPTRKSRYEAALNAWK
ncbi:phage endolysin [Burkholderia phage BcepF1]|uniref:Phage endolysin n=1 Tax=Burkholderia phage BcepF1 TaxID=2886897 RepID=A1YZZ8_9CAUD|nr:endolysin [Burkholderia phage BcepF1]ABL96825.1 phage endolysin [Burkholderia phage BcepF1]